MTSIGHFLLFVLNVYSWIVLASAIASWLIALNVLKPKSDQVKNLLSLLEKCADPILKPLRKYVPSIAGFDVTPIIALIGIYIVQRLVFRVFIAPNIMIL